METTGDPIFGVMWTTLHLPCLTLPFGTGPAGLPLGVQVVARHGRDTKLFIHAEWMRSVLE
jgi:Asp-tRNA(Asn)/Glu-tRNA(Gln) amidotransferase A subunit family amidase